MQRVAGTGATELPARHLALHLVVADEADAGGGDGVAAARHFEEHVGLGAGGKVKLEMPDRVVTASETAMGADPPSTTW